MTATLTAHRPSRLRLAASDGRAITWRNLRGMTRIPQVMMFSTIQPLIFVLTFRYVFGGAIKIPGVRYVDFLMPGVFVQTVAFGAMNTAVGLAEDLRSGMLDRFRSLPIARSAVLAGRSIADLVRNVVVVTLMVLVGFLVGFRVHTNALAFLLGLVILLYFSFALSWVFALIGLSMPNARPRKRRRSPCSHCWCSHPPRSRPPARCPAGCASTPSTNPSPTPQKRYGRSCSVARRRARCSKRWHGPLASCWCSFRSRCAATAASRAERVSR